MFENVDGAQRAAAQACWDRLRATINPFAVAFRSHDLTALRIAASQPDADGDLPLLLAENPFCPAELVAELVASPQPNARLSAAQHRNCPAEAAIAAVEQAVDVRRELPDVAMFLPRRALGAMMSGARRCVGSRPANRAAVANMVAVAHSGFVASPTTAATRRWLAERDVASLGSLLRSGEFDCGMLVGRGDLSDDETVLLLRRLLRPFPVGARLLVAARPVSVTVARRALLSPENLRDPACDGSVDMLVALLADRPPTQQLEVLRVLGERELLPQPLADRLWRTALELTAVEAAVLDGRSMVGFDQLCAPLGWLGGEAKVAELLDRRASAPAALWSLTVPQLDAFQSLGARWAGTVNDLCAVVSRSF